MWARVVNIFLGLWLMIVPAVVSVNSTASDNFPSVGPLVVSVSVITIWAVTQGRRWRTASPLACCSLLAFVRGDIKPELGGGWSALFH